MSASLFNEEPVNKVTEFVEMFKRVKTECKGKKSMLQGLGDEETKKLRALVSRGYTIAQMELAARAMFTEKDGWAVTKKKDNPLHFLRQFDTYLEMAAESPDKSSKKHIPETPEQIEEREKEAQRLEWLKVAKVQYSKSLEKGEWIGTISDAISIGRMFASSFTAEEKSKFFTQAKGMSQGETVRLGTTTPAMQAMMMALATPENLFCEVVVKEAVKRKIKEPW